MGRRRNTIEPLAPDVRTLAKIGSILAHVEEFFGSGSHHFDKAAIDSLMADPDVIGWIEGMRKLALLPVPRSQASGEVKPWDALSDKLKAMTKWLEKNQPDVIRRGLWDALNASQSDAGAKHET